TGACSPSSPVLRMGGMSCGCGRSTPSPPVLWMAPRGPPFHSGRRTAAPSASSPTPSSRRSRRREGRRRHSARPPSAGVDPGARTGRFSSLLTSAIRSTASPRRGGEPVPVTLLDETRHQFNHRWPWFLPDGRHFLFFARTSSDESTGTYLGSLDSREQKFIVAGRSNAVYGAPGSLLFLRGSTLRE